MPMYLSDASWDAVQPLSQVLESLDTIVQRTGGQVVQVLQLEDGLSLTIETPDDLSLFRIGREASELGLELTSRVALSRIEAEALDSAHRERST
ncbi:MAG: hypothetical protein OXN86_09590 [Chloroflexota bacterium]|nr:hypothetical protein [Chloroflexota bacterium]